MNKLLCIQFLIIITSSCSISTIDVDEIERGENGLTYYKETDILFSGVVTREFDNGRLASKTNFVKGKNIGEWYFYDTGGERYIAGQGESVEVPKVIIDKYPKLYLTNTTLSFGTEDIRKPFHYYCSVILLEKTYSAGDEVLINFVNDIYINFMNKYDFDEIDIGYEHSNEVYYDFKNLPLNLNDYNKDTTDLYDKIRINIY